MLKAEEKDVQLSDAATEKYLNIAHQEIRKQPKARSEYHDRLKPLMKFPGNPSCQVDLGRNCVNQSARWDGCAPTSVRADISHNVKPVDETTTVA